MNAPHTHEQVKPPPPPPLPPPAPVSFQEVFPSCKMYVPLTSTDLSILCQVGRLPVVSAEMGRKKSVLSVSQRLLVFYFTSFSHHLYPYLALSSSLLITAVTSPYQIVVQHLVCSTSYVLLILRSRVSRKSLAAVMSPRVFHKSFSFFKFFTIVFHYCRII